MSLIYQEYRVLNPVVLIYIHRIGSHKRRLPRICKKVAIRRCSEDIIYKLTYHTTYIPNASLIIPREG